MATLESLALLVKSALSDGTASSSTVKTLQTLLANKPGIQAEKTARNATSTLKTSRPAKNSKPAARVPRKNDDFRIHEDEGGALLPRARYALAVEVISISLKTLAEAAKSELEAQKGAVAKGKSNAARHSSPTRSMPNPALQLRSGNNPKPVPPSPSRNSTKGRKSPQCTGLERVTECVVATAHCTQLAFSHIRSVDASKLGIRETPRLQFESAMVSFCRALITLELHSLAISELRAVKRRLESLLPPAPTAKPSKPAAAKARNPDDVEPVVFLLCPDVDLEACMEAIPLVMDYQLLVIQVIAALRDPDTVRQTLPFLSLENPRSPSATAHRFVSNTQDPSKAAKYLSVLHQRVLQLCPSIGVSLDHEAQNGSKYASPQCMFQLQMIALRLRKEMWRLSKDRAAAEKDLAVFFPRALSALIRRSRCSNSPGFLEVCNAAYDDLGLKDPDQCLSILPNSRLDPDERGPLLEWQLSWALRLAKKRENEELLAQILPRCLESLAEAYNGIRYPLRRARVTILAIRLQDEFPHHLTLETLSKLTRTSAIDEGSLVMDEELRPYAADIQASLLMARAFHEGQPTLVRLKPAITFWNNTLADVQTAQELEKVVESPPDLLTRLTCLEGHIAMLGDDETRLPVALMLRRVARFLGSPSEQCSSLLKLCRAYEALGYAEKGTETLEEAEVILNDHPTLERDVLDFHLCQAELSLKFDRLKDCRMALEKAFRTGRLLDSRMFRSCPRAYKVLLAHSWILYSRYLLAVGASQDALHAAQQGFRTCNSLWHDMEQASDHSEKPTVPNLTEPPQSSLDGLTKGISRLNLKPEAGSTHRAHEKTRMKGAAFWPMVRWLCQALMHIADVWVHHGRFEDGADFYSRQAVKIARFVPAPALLSRIQCHRSRILVSAGLADEGELCLAQEDDIRNVTLAMVDRLRAEAILSTHHGELDKSLNILNKAERVVKTLQLQSNLALLEDFNAIDILLADSATVAVNGPNRSSSSEPQGKSRQADVPKQATTLAARPKIDGTIRKNPQPKAGFYLLNKLQCYISVEKEMISSNVKNSSSETLKLLRERHGPAINGFRWLQLEYKSNMNKVLRAVETDVSFSVLPETVLSFPALQRLDRRLSAHVDVTSLIVAPVSKPKGKISRPTKAAKKFAGPEDSLENLLSTARSCLINRSSCHDLLTTAETHLQYAMLSRVSLVLSATSAIQSRILLHPVREAFTIDFPRIHASATQQTAARIEDNVSQASKRQLQWPTMESQSPAVSCTAKDFQEKYLDLIPSGWTVVSVGLSEACNELYIVRYRCGQSPIIIRLPFSRAKHEEADEEFFDFHSAKAELKEIIEMSNFGCHEPLDTAVKNAKSKWWTERKELDRSLHSLIFSMESKWLGGFKTVFSEHERDQDQLDRFRKAFDATLERHLPSRSRNKRRAGVTLDDEVLDLFIGLGNDLDSQEDIDECLEDLLYFIVDILQFNGEPNAYDEVDFDSMAVEIRDALCAYHESVEDQSDREGHIILVLDKRLQVFPWESMPCLERRSVSRVDSMFTLRQRLVEMRRRRTTESSDARFTVPRGSGTYILNPSQDLINTEGLLGPTLSRLADTSDTKWTSIVHRAPSEDEYKSALSSSSTFLYFGHGGGSQYIRPRSIRRLEQCSEVVWLMGCSSGAVTEYGELEPSGIPLSYMLAGRKSSSDESTGNKCMAVLATLWDVTDKDIDRFSLAVGEEWGLWNASQEPTIKLPTKTPRKRERVVVPSTPDRPPKTPKAHKTPAPARTPARSSSRARGDENRKKSLVEAVARSRESCYLRYLNGAAPVVYGVPVWLGD